MKYCINCQRTEFFNDFEGMKYLDCEVIDPRFCQYLVGTTDSEIKESLRSVQNQNIQQRKYIFLKVHRNIQQYTDQQLSDIHKAGSQEFTDWCNDVCLYFCYRYILLSKPIPFVLSK